MLTSPVDFVLTFSTGLVAFALVASAMGKFGQTAATLRAMHDLRVPAPLRRPTIAKALPLGELTIALALLVVPSVGRQVAGLLATVMLAVFTVMLIGVLKRGEEVDCQCFGALSAENHVTVWSVLRNVVLLVAAALVGFLGAGSPAFVVGIFTADRGDTLLAILGWSLTAIFVLSRMVVAMRRAPVRTDPDISPRAQRTPAPLSPLSLALGIDPARPGEVAMGDPIPSAELVSIDGRSRLLSDLSDGRPTLLIFLSTGCSSCTPVADAAPAWQDRLGGVALRVATSSEPNAIAASYPLLLPVTRFGSLAALAALGVQRSPAAVVLGGQQQPIIASPIAYGIVEIEALVQSIAAAAGS